MWCSLTEAFEKGRYFTLLLAPLWQKKFIITILWPQDTISWPQDSNFWPQDSNSWP